MHPHVRLNPAGENNLAFYLNRRGIATGNARTSEYGE